MTGKGYLKKQGFADIELFTSKGKFERTELISTTLEKYHGGPLFQQALRIMRDLAEHQNGAPLIRHEEKYNKTMAEVWEFLEANEAKY